MISATELRYEVQAFINDGVELVRKEVQLAKAELGEKANQVQSGLVSLLAGALIGLVGLIFLGHAAVYYLSTMTTPTNAALIVAALLLVISIIMLAVARSNLNARELKPRRTIDAAKNIRNDIGGRTNA